jgi:hypothetical protein
MANRLTKGEALVGALDTDADANIGDDAYVAGAFGKGVTVTTEADGASMAISAAELLGGIIVATPTEARNIQAPTAEALVAAVDAGTDTGLGFEFTIINLAGSTHALTLTVNTGTTLVGSVTVAAASSATFVARIASSTAVVIYRK